MDCRCVVMVTAPVFVFSEMEKCLCDVGHCALRTLLRD